MVGVIIAAAIAILLPRTTGFLARGGMRSEARRLAALARYLRHEASRSGKTHYLTFDLGADTYWVTVDEGRGRPAEARTPLGGAHVLADGVRLRDVTVHGRGRRSSGRQQIAFTPKGECDEAIVHFSDWRRGRVFSLHIKPYFGRSDIYEHDFRGEG